MRRSLVVLSDLSRVSADDLLRRLMEARAGNLARPDYEEPTFKCPACCDTGFLTSRHQNGLVYGSKCSCLLAEIAKKPKRQLKLRGRQNVDDDGMPVF